MKKSKIGLFTILLMFTTLFASELITNFTGSYQNGKIVLEWKSGDESELSNYSIQRSMNYGDSYTDLVKKIQPLGTGFSYMIFDESIIGSKSNLVYTYRILANMEDGSVNASTTPITISLSVSSVDMTWGSIKAMFR